MQRTVQLLQRTRVSRRKLALDEGSVKAMRANMMSVVGSSDGLSSYRSEADDDEEGAPLVALTGASAVGQVGRTLYPVPCTLYPVPCTLTGASATSRWARSAVPCTLYPVPCTMYPARGLCRPAGGPASE